MAIHINTVDKYVDKYGETVTIKLKSEAEFSDYGDVTDTSSTITAKAVYNVYSQENIHQLEGGFKDGDKTFFFKSSQASIEIGNSIIRADSSEYEIDDVLDPGIYGNSYVKEAKVNRV